MRRTTGISAKMSGKTKIKTSLRLRPREYLFSSKVRLEAGGRAWLDVIRWTVVVRGRLATEGALGGPGRSMEGPGGDKEESKYANGTEAGAGTGELRRCAPDGSSMGRRLGEGERR